MNLDTPYLWYKDDALSAEGAEDHEGSIEGIHKVCLVR